ncbi:MAG: 2-oxo acid dehydrogenase subunit E2, partial [Solirubrobacterales bacterium]|nr:2-oxo acid dehydrogenase subunit E2 [Solirubrobacterales bacterium]
MEEGTIVRWLKRDGEQVAQGEPLAEVETDKATVTFDADADGTLRILVGEGETVPIGKLIARIGDGAAAQAQSAPAAYENGAQRVKASPLARRMAREAGIELTGVSGSGPGGRIVKADLTGAAQAAPQPPAPHSGAAALPQARPSGNKGRVTIQQPTRTQVQIAQRMSESRATIPSFALEVVVDMNAAVTMRSQLREAVRPGELVPSYNDMVVKACAVALRDHPRANGAYRDGAFELYERVNVGIAVATDDSLIVPTVFDADQKSLVEIARETRTLLMRVRERVITPAELSGGTFTVSNLGMYGVASFEAIINPPQAAILAVGELRELPVLRAGLVVPGSQMSIVLSCDHRILYGAPAAQFLARIRQLLEQPVNLLL